MRNYLYIIDWLSYVHYLFCIFAQTTVGSPNLVRCLDINMTIILVYEIYFYDRASLSSAIYI